MKYVYVFYGFTGLFLISTTPTLSQRRQSEGNEFCLVRTNLTIFVDGFDFGLVEWNLSYFNFLKGILRNPCFTLKLYDPMRRTYTTLNKGETLEVQLELLMLYLSSKSQHPIDTTELLEFTSTLKPNCLLADFRNIVLFLTKFRSTERFEILQELSGFGNCHVISMVFHSASYESHFNQQNTLLLSKLPNHQIISSTISILYRDEIDRVLPSQSAIYNLILNPRFNRFEYNSKTLLTDFNFPDIFINATIVLNVYAKDLTQFFDWDGIAQFANFLNFKFQKLTGAKLYCVVLLEKGFVKHSEEIAVAYRMHSYLNKLNVPWMSQNEANELSTVKQTLKLNFVYLLNRHLHTEVIDGATFYFHHECENSGNNGVLCQEDLMLERYLRMVMEKMIFIKRQMKVPKE